MKRAAPLNTRVIRKWNTLTADMEQMERRPTSCIIPFSWCVIHSKAEFPSLWGQGGWGGCQGGVWDHRGWLAGSPGSCCLQDGSAPWGAGAGAQAGRCSKDGARETARCHQPLSTRRSAAQDSGDQVRPGLIHHLNIPGPLRTMLNLLCLCSVNGTTKSGWQHIYYVVCYFKKLLGDSDGRESCRRPRFDPWVRKIPWRRKHQPTPVILPGEFHGQRSLVGYSPWGHKESDTTERQTLFF